MKSVNSQIRSLSLPRELFGLSRVFTLLLLVLAACGGPVAVDKANLRTDLAALAADEMEGRAPGTPGGEKAAAYIAQRFEDVGLSPGFAGGYFQPVPMVGLDLKGDPSASWSAGTGETTLRIPEDIIAWPGVDQVEVRLERAPMVFVGYGINAPDAGWNDYDGVDVKGKVVVSLVNDPPSQDRDFFGGPALTYFGRWTYKIEEAVRQGAAGILLVHTTEMAGYPWSVVEGSWTGEQFSLPRKEPKSTLVEAWISSEAAEQLFAASGLSLAQALERAATAGFRAAELKTVFSCSMEPVSRRIESQNVGGLVEGSNPDLRGELIVLTSHYDHLGIGPEVAGDRIYNGALDNASGTALLIELGRVLAAERDGLGRSVLFLAVTGEEQGLLGSEYFVAHRSDAPGRPVVDVNFDSVNVWAETIDLVALGADQSSIDEVVDDVFRQFDIHRAGDPAPERGSFFRSDHFSFVKAGIPAVYFDAGPNFRDGEADSTKPIGVQYQERNYHQPSDEYDPDWPLSGAAQLGEVIRQTVLRMAAARFTPAWKPDSPFNPSGASGSR